ncbi:MAG: LacI family DNA-binding transcriptional regulator [Rubrivivax sp.]|nr:LacI family DNA-binding transcriptional regulator [Rubrivivax sp.]
MAEHPLPPLDPIAPDADAALPAPGARQSRRGHGRVTLRDVARAAGVTSITVSRFLREPQLVAGETADRIRLALAGTGYVPNRQAGLLASGVSNIVATLLPNLANSIFAETAQGLSDTLQAAGYEQLIAATGYSLEREEEQLRALLGWRPAAVVVTGRRHSVGAHALLEAAQAAGTPVIEVWDHPWADEPAAAPRYTQVGFSHDAIGRAMAEHLLAAGHRQLVYVDSGVLEDYRAHERGLAFVERAREAGAQARVRVAPAGDPFDAGRQVLRALWPEAAQASARRVARPSAAAFANDHLACGALLEAQERGIEVPGQLALLGFGDFALARQLQPALSSVSLPRYEIGVKAAQALLHPLTGRGRAPSFELPWRIVPRRSTGALPR